MSYEPPIHSRPKRRTRYAGKHPRRFEEKYKEHQPDRFREDVEKVLASGKTPAGSHRPIMVREIMDILRPVSGDIAVDCTLGYGGHAVELLRAVQPTGRLIALDQDPVELPKTEARLRAQGLPPGSLLVRKMNYAGLAALLAIEASDGVDAILADLGVSSMQIDDPTRGFTFKADAPLDMRMNPNKGLSAALLLERVSAPELTDWLTDYGDEPAAEAIAASIVQSHPQTTLALAELVRRVVREHSRRILEEEVETSVRRVFQAIRIAVNDEFSALETWLRNLPPCLRPGGRVAVLTFHSGEDRRVKQAFKAGLHDGIYAEVNDLVGRPSPEEQRANPRSAPAKLRWAIRA